MIPDEHLPEEAYALALADLPGIGPARLVSLLTRDRPSAVWHQVLSGAVRRRQADDGPDVDAPPPGVEGPEWAEVAARTPVVDRWRAVQAAGIQVAWLGGKGMPAVCAADPEPPGVLFSLGDLSVLERPRVAIVGTRDCTGYGRGFARELGHDLAAAGVCVVSGLALGIDGGAHEGALLAAGAVGRGVGAGGVGAGAGPLGAGAVAGPLGVAASGVDVPYPRRHRELWNHVVRAGAMISETPPGRPAQSWRFPARNRLIAGLSQAVVVVESHAGGGSMLTVAAAAERGIDIMAVPGPVNSAASIGTNQLLHEGLAPARHAGDVLAVLGDLRPWPPLRDRAPVSAKATAGTPPGRSSHRVAPSSSMAGDASGAPGMAGARVTGSVAAAALFAATEGPRHLGALEPAERRVLDAIDRTPTETAVIATRTGLPLRTLGSVLIRLETAGLIRGEGLWWERRRT